MPAPAPVRVFFDYISNNAYLAWHVLPDLAARHGRAVEPVPVLFAGLLEAHGQLGPAEVRAKALWMWKNTLRKAALLGIPLHPPAFHPFNPLLALRASSLDMEDEVRAALVTALFRAVWVERRHVSEPEVVAEVARSVGIDGPRLVEEARTPEAKTRLRARTDAAIAEGVFGVPTMQVEGELFWGYDDLPFLERFLAGEDPLQTAQSPVPAGPPPASAVRRRFRETGTPEETPGRAPR